MYKLVAVDIDDTLLTDDHTIPESTRSAIKAAMDKGVCVTLATGRMYASARRIAEELLGFNVPLITYQGALVRNALDGEILYERSVPEKQAAELYDYCIRNGLHLQLYHNDTLYVREANEKANDYAKLSSISFVVPERFEEIAKLPNTKMLIIDEAEKLDRVKEELTPLLGPSVHITKSKPIFLEIMHAEGTKGHALRFLAQHIGCTMEQSIALGDSWNDVEMIRAAGLGVAMGNAVDSLKQIADVVTLTNNEEGVRRILEQYVLA